MNVLWCAEDRGGRFVVRDIARSGLKWIVSIFDRWELFQPSDLFFSPNLVSRLRDGAPRRLRRRCARIQAA